MVKPTEKRVYFTRHAQSEHEYVHVLICTFSPALTDCISVYSVTCNSNSQYPFHIAGGSPTLDLQSDIFDSS